MSANIDEYLDPTSCPSAPPARAAMAAETRALHDDIDAAIRKGGVPYLHPQDPTVMLDLLGSRRMIDWQEGKASAVFDGESAWSELPQVYARYGVEFTRGLLRRVRAWENAAGALLTDCGMQACAVLFDALIRRGSHVILMRQVYNKTHRYLEWLCSRVAAEISVVDDGDYEQIEEALRPNTALIFAETYTNPLTRAVDPERLGALAERARRDASRGVRLILDHTIATPWGVRKPLLDYEGVDFVVSSGTKALAGHDRDLWGFIASNRIDTLNEAMDLQAMRGGILDWRRARVIIEGLAEAEEAFVRRCRSAAKVASFLAAHPKVSETFHPSLPGHPDREIIDRFYSHPGSLLSFRVHGADEDAARHFADVLVTCGVPRYALSFDGLTTKVNHHVTVSEYFTPAEELQRMGVDRLIRLGIGIEDAGDIIACLNWALWNHERIPAETVRQWQEERTRELRISGTGKSPGRGGVSDPQRRSENSKD